MDGSKCEQGKNNSLTSSISVFLRRLYNGWFMCKHSTDRGQAKSFQSILRNPVALSCFLGEHCSLMCQSVCTQAATVSKRAEFLFWHKAFTADELHWRSLELSKSNTKQEGHWDGATCVWKSTDGGRDRKWESFKKEWGSLLRQTVAAGGGSVRVSCCNTPLVVLDK